MVVSSRVGVFKEDSNSNYWGRKLSVVCRATNEVLYVDEGLAGCEVAATLKSGTISFLLLLIDKNHT